MPNPLSQVRPDASISLGPIALDHQPEISHGIALVISSWSYIDNLLGLSLAKLLGAQAHIGAGLYLNLSGGTAKKAVLAAAASTALEGEDLGLFEILLGLAASAKKERNNIAHDMWAYSVDVPGALLLIPQSVLLKLQGDRERLFFTDPESTTPPPTLKDEDVQVYKQEELIALYNRIVKLSKLFILFWRSYESNPITRDAHRRQLIAEPEIQEVMRQKTDRRPVPATPPQSLPATPLP